jgi:hypothetical protein
MAWLTGWTKRRDISIPAAKVTGTHGEFQTLVDLTDLYGQANADGSDIRFTESDGETLLDYHLVPRLRSRHCWTWFNYPVAFRHVDTKDCTYIGANSLTPGQATAYQQILQYNNTTGELNIGGPNSAGTQKDDHNNPVCYVRSDGKILICYCSHGQSNKMWSSVSTNVEDVSLWGTVTELSPGAADAWVSYQQIHHLSSEGTGVGRIYRFYRQQVSGGSYVDWWYYTSDDEGDTWSGPTKVYSGSVTYLRPYMVTCNNGVDRIDFLMCDDPPNINGKRLLHFYYDGTWRKSDGTATTLPLDRDKATIVYTSVTDMGVWVSCIELDASDNPHCLWYLQGHYPTGGDHDLYYIKWNGSAWDSEVKICDEGDGIGDSQVNDWYPGVATFDPEDLTTIWVAKEETKYEIQKWETTDSGVTWAKTADLTTDSDFDNARPIGIRNHNGYFTVVWWGNGTYDGILFEWETYLVSNSYGWNAHWWNARNARFVATSIGGADATFYVYYGNPSAVDAQDETAVWDGIANTQNVLHMLGGEAYVDMPDDSGNSNDGVVVSSNVSTDYAGKFPALFLNRDATLGGTHDIPLTGIDYAGLTDLTVLVYGRWETINFGTRTQILGSSEAGPYAQSSVNARLTHATGLLELVVVRETDTYTPANFAGVGGTPGTSYQQFSVLFDHDGVGGKVLFARVDQTEYTSSVTSGAAMDADSSLSVAIGKSDAVCWRGPIAFMMITNSVLSKDWTDTHYTMMTDSEFAEVGAEESLNQAVVRRKWYPLFVPITEDLNSSSSSSSSSSSESSSSVSTSSISTSSSTGILEYPFSKSVLSVGPVSSSISVGTGPSSLGVAKPV